MGTTQPWGFMRLPPEVRCEVYPHLLKIRSEWKRASPQILRTCRIIYEEASQLLYDLNTIPIFFEPRAIVANLAFYRLAELQPLHTARGNDLHNSSCLSIPKSNNLELPAIPSLTTTLISDSPGLPAMLERCRYLKVYVQIIPPEPDLQEYRQLESVLWSFRKALSMNNLLTSIELVIYSDLPSEMSTRWKYWIIARRNSILDQFKAIPGLRQVRDTLYRCGHYGDTDSGLLTASTPSTLAGRILWADGGLHICQRTR